MHSVRFLTEEYTMYYTITSDKSEKYESFIFKECLFLNYKLGKLRSPILFFSSLRLAHIMPHDSLYSHLSRRSLCLSFLLSFDLFISQLSPLIHWKHFTNAFVGQIQTQTPILCVSECTTNSKIHATSARKKRVENENVDIVACSASLSKYLKKKKRNATWSDPSIFPC